MMKKLAFLTILCLLTFMGLKAQVIADFESEATTPPLSCDGENTAVVDNPDPSGSNTSAKVGYYKKIAGNWHYVSMSFPNKIQIKTNNTLTFKVYCSQQGRIFAKFWLGDEVVVENWAPEYNFKPAANTWVECTMDMTSAMGKEFDVLQLAACVDNEAEADVFFDDVTISNPDIGDGSPYATFKVSKSKISVGETISFDASGSFDYLDGTIASYNWDFGDGNTGSGVTVDHTYTSAGVFQPMLTLIDNEAKTKSKSITVFVLSTNEKLSPLNIITANPKTYEKIEAIFQVRDNYKNVFNPDEVAIDAEITNPDGTKYTMPCFYFINSINQKNTWIIDSSYQAWMLRFTSKQAGTHKIKLTLSDNAGTTTSPEYSVEVAQGTAKGFVVRDAANKQYYRHTTGEPFYPQGINEGWDNTSNYIKIINNLSDAGANIIRYWLTPFNKQAMEWSQTSFYDGLGKYSQAASGMMDSLLNHCASNDFYIQLAMFQHGPFSENVDAMWNTNPYNSANGGFVDKAEEFFYNDSCDVYIKKLLRYEVARWGYSTHLYAWEFFNEVQFTGNFQNTSSKWYPAILNWHSRMSKYMQTIDPYNHLQTTSVEHTMMPDFDTVPNLDIVQYHLYSDNLLSDQKDHDFEFRKEITHKGVINGEFGTNVLKADVTADQQRTSIWNTIMNQTPHFTWIWEHYTDQTWSNLFKLATSFTSTEDFTAQGNLEQVSPTTYWGSTELVTNMFRSPQNFYGYVYDASFSTGVEGAYIHLSDVPYAYYDVTYYYPATGGTSTEENVPIIRTKNKILFPTFDKDLAFKIKYKSAYTLPIAIAGEDTVVAPGDVIHLSAIKSYNPSGKPLEYLWAINEKPTGSEMTITNSTLRDIQIIPDKSGTYKVSLTVNDADNSSTPDVITIIVSTKPIAEAGNDTTVYMATKYFTFNGNGSYDADADPLTYNWTIISAPTGSGKKLYSFDTQTPKLKLDATGDFVLSLVVSDGISLSKADTVVLTVKEGNSITDNNNLDYLSIYPNPVYKTLYIENDEQFIAGTTIEILDIQGRIINELIIGQNEVRIKIDMEKYCTSSGLYYMRVSNRKGVNTYKVIYQK
jgi:hypothetical protein